MGSWLGVDETWKHPLRKVGRKPGIKAGEESLGMGVDLGSSHIKETMRASVHRKGVPYKETHLECR